MVNILTHPGAEANFEKAKKEAGRTSRKEGEPSAIFDSSSNLMKQELAKAKSRGGHSKAPFVLGHVIKPGCISFYTKNGLTYAIPEGRWWLMKSPLVAHWMESLRNVSLDTDLIRAGEARILRVEPGEVGMIQAHGTPMLLDVGTHVFNSGAVTIKGKVSYSEQKYFHHGPLHYLRVDRGFFAKVWTVVKVNERDMVMPRVRWKVFYYINVVVLRSVLISFICFPLQLIGEGIHYIDNHLFKFDGFVRCSDNVIEHGSIHRISVTKGMVAKVIQDSKNRILGEGDHLIESTDFQFVGFEDITKTLCIQHGTITILRVTRGQIALAWKDSDPIFISEPGVYEFDSADFKFESFR